MYLHYWVSQSREAAAIHCINFNMCKAIFKNPTNMRNDSVELYLILVTQAWEETAEAGLWVYGTWDMLQAVKTPSRPPSWPVPGCQGGNEGADYPI